MGHKEAVPRAGSPETNEGLPSARASQFFLTTAISCEFTVIPKYREAD